MDIKVYVAAPWDKKTEGKAARTFLQKAGYEVTSGWLDLPDDIEKTEKYMIEQALNDWNHLFSADILVLLNLHKSEGKACETGMALAVGMPVILVGKKENNIFLHLPEIIRVEGLEEIPPIVEYLKQIAEQQEALKNTPVAEMVSE